MIRIIRDGSGISRTTMENGFVSCRSGGIVGKVLITRVEMDDGALYVRVRYVDLTAAHLGTQMAINEMISDLEALSDEATRKHRLEGGSDASA